MERNGLATVAVTLATAAIVSLLLYLSTVPTTLKVAVTAGDSPDTRLMAAFAQALARERAPVRLKLVHTPGSADSASRLDDESVGLAVVRMDIATPAAGQSVAVLRRYQPVFMAPAAGGVQRIADLRGRAIGVTGGPAGNLRLLATILEQYEIPADAVSMLALEEREIAPALREGRIAALLFVGAAGSRQAAETLEAFREASGGPPLFLPIREAGAIAVRNKAVEAGEIVRGAFGGDPPKPAETLPTISVSYRLLAHRQLDDDTVSDLTRLLFTMRGQLATGVASAQSLEAPSADKGAALAAHPGTAAYLNGEEKTFFERYGDWIYLSLFGISFAGSGAAALASRHASRVRARTMQGLERLLELLRGAREAESEGTLGNLEREADSILADTLHRATRDKIDAAGLAAYRLGMDQLAYAIDERRQVLTRGGPPERATASARTLRQAGH